MKAYTRTGDQGETSLYGGGRVPKSHLRVSAYGTLDELNCVLGLVRTALPAAPAFRAMDEALARVQAECFAVGAILASPATSLAEPYDRGMPAAAVTHLETEIDAWDLALPPLKTFILPGGTNASATLHLARAVSRRAERAVVALAAQEPVGENILPYLNRLSSWLFTAARWVSLKRGRPEIPWEGLATK